MDIIDWVNKMLAEEWAGSPAGDLGSGEADQAFVREVFEVFDPWASACIGVSSLPPPPPSLSVCFCLSVCIL